MGSCSHDIMIRIDFVTINDHATAEEAARAAWSEERKRWPFGFGCQPKHTIQFEQHGGRHRVSAAVRRGVWR